MSSSSSTNPKPKLSAGRLLYLTVHQPLGTLERSWREGGPLNQWITRRGRLAMIEAARHLPPVAAPAADAPEVVFLTGKRFWYQTAFCLWSLTKQSGRSFNPVFLDDGTFDDELRAECRRIFPGAKTPSQAETEARLERALPLAKFPALRGQRLSYLHLRKITDAHAGLSGWRLVLDSDMLFFRKPDVLLDWFATPTRPIHMMDVQDAYGYPTASLTELAGRPLPSKVNVGVCGFRSDTIDWEKLEWWCAQLLARHGTSYYLEQALAALLFGQEDPVRLPASDYQLMPVESETRKPSAVLHHYVAESKRGYFRHAWKHVANA